MFVDLAISEGARDGVDEASVRARLRALANAEGKIVKGLIEQEDRATVHG